MYNMFNGNVANRPITYVISFVVYLIQTENILINNCKPLEIGGPYRYPDNLNAIPIMPDNPSLLEPFVVILEILRVFYALLRFSYLLISRHSQRGGLK